MAIPHYLAMTAAEYGGALPQRCAWMACHFSPYRRGLSNLPRELPPDSLLMVDDITPIHGHDPQVICAQLAERVEALGCRGVLLDFQRPGYEEAAALADFLGGRLPCPVGVSEPYARELSCPVFLPPVPAHMGLEAYLSPWRGRELWLETALSAECLTLTPTGAAITPLSPEEWAPGGFYDEKLRCSYTIEPRKDAVSFRLWRRQRELSALLEDGETLGVTLAVGLYQELFPLLSEDP